jgi:hypothetical protein
VGETGYREEVAWNALRDNNYFVLTLLLLGADDIGDSTDI